MELVNGDHLLTGMMSAAQLHQAGRKLKNLSQQLAEGAISGLVHRWGCNPHNQMRPTHLTDLVTRCPRLQFHREPGPCRASLKTSR